MHHIYRITSTCPHFALDHSKLTKELIGINPSKAAGPDCISSRDLKLVGESLAGGLQSLFRFSLRNSMVPSQWKTSRMHTVYKKGDSLDRGNYRPLQMLSLPSKLLESTVCGNIDKFVQENRLSHQNQWGFVQGKSTEGLLTYLTETWKKALDNGM